MTAGICLPVRPRKSSAVCRGRSVPINVHTATYMDGRKVAQGITRHQVAGNDYRSDLGRFSGDTMQTPVGYSSPILA